MPRITLSAAILSIAFGCFCSASAQVWTPMPPPTVDMQNQIWRNFRIAQIGNQVAADMARLQGGQKTAAAKPVAANGSVYQKQFAFTRSQRSPLAEKMAVSKTGTSQAEVAKMQQVVDYMWDKYQRSFADENRRLGMPFNDVAAAMTYYIVGGYLYANDLASLQSEYSVAVYRQVSSVLSKDAAFAKLSTSDKQLLADLLITIGGTPVALYEQSRDKNDQKAAGKANLERLFGRGAAKMRITANGVEF